MLYTGQVTCQWSSLEGTGAPPRTTFCVIGRRGDSGKFRPNRIDALLAEAGAELDRPITIQRTSPARPWRHTEVQTSRQLTEPCSARLERLQRNLDSFGRANSMVRRSVFDLKRRRRSGAGSTGREGVGPTTRRSVGQRIG